MPGPSLVDTCRLLIQAIRTIAARALPGQSVPVGLHTSLDFRQATVGNDTDADPTTVTFPYVALIGPQLQQETQRPIRLGYSIYRNKDLSALTAVKEPYPQFYHLNFQVIIDALNMANGVAPGLVLVPAILAWAQESPRIAGLKVDLVQDFNISDAPEPGSGTDGDAVRATGSIMLRSWRSYGGVPEPVRLVRTVGLSIYDGMPTPIAWRIEPSNVTDDLRAGFAISSSLFLAVGDAGAVVRSSGNSIWMTDAPVTSQDLTGVWGSGPSDIWAVGSAGTVIHYDGAAWSIVDIGAGATNLTAVFGTAAIRVFICGEGGTLFVYNGTAWTQLTTGLAPDPVTTIIPALRAMWGVAGAGLQIVGDAGTALEVATNNSVTIVPTGTSADLRAVTGTLSGLRFFAGGEAGFMVSRNSGDASWAMVDRGVGGLMEIYGAWKAPRFAPATARATPENVYLCGDLGRVVRRSPSAGAQMSPTGVVLDLFALFGADESSLFACGQDGAIYRYSAQASVAAPRLIKTRSFL
jgi:hypothetical protein